MLTTVHPRAHMADLVMGFVPAQAVGPAAVSRLVDGVRSGTCPFDLGCGQPLFDYLGSHPEDAVLFDAAMNGFHGPETDAVLAEQQERSGH